MPRTPSFPEYSQVVGRPAECVVAHRGGRWPGLTENTLEAFAAAVDLGLPWIETDVHASRDGVLYAFHDDRLDRIAGHDLAIGDVDAATIDTLELPGGTRIPRFAQVLVEFPETSFNIDVKADRSIASTVRTLRSTGAEARVRVASFSSRRLGTLRSALPGVRTSAGTAEIAAFLLGRTTIARRFHPSVDCLQVPVREGVVPVVTAATVRAAHAAGLEVHVWTVNEESEMERLLRLGVDVLVTDEPRLALEVTSRVASGNGRTR